MLPCVAIARMAGEPLLAVQSNGRVETVDEWRGRVVQTNIQLTMGIRDVPVRIVRCT